MVKSPKNKNRYITHKDTGPKMQIGCSQMETYRLLIFWIPIKT